MVTRAKELLRVSFLLYTGALTTAEQCHSRLAARAAYAYLTVVLLRHCPTVVMMVVVILNLLRLLSRLKSQVLLLLQELLVLLWGLLVRLPELHRLCLILFVLPLRSQGLTQALKRQAAILLLDLRVQAD